MDRDPTERLEHAKKAARAKQRWTPDEVRALRQRRRDGAKVVDLAAEQGVSNSQMSMMLSRATYKDVL